MRLIAIMFGTALSVAAATAHADEDVAQQLGMLLASEKMCGLQYKPEAIKQFIEMRVAVRDLNFAGNLAFWTSHRKDLDEGMTKSEIAARCTQVSRLAKYYRLID